MPVSNILTHYNFWDKTPQVEVRIVLHENTKIRFSQVDWLLQVY